MKQRVDIKKALPEVYKAMYGLAGSINNSSLTPIQKQLIKIRASQINACAYCLDMHTKEALQIGETLQRIFVLNAWREAHLFTDEEKALLAITEEITLIYDKGLSEATYNRALNYFSEDVIAQIIMTVVLINAWNRIAVSSLMSIPDAD